MKIAYDSASGRVVIGFRAMIIVLPDVYEDQATAVAAAEGYCRERGWVPQGKPTVRSAW
jgi:hypothetical protein